MQCPSKGTQYMPLYERLLGGAGSRCHMTFADIEQLLDQKLPRSACRWPAWWGNENNATSSSRHSNAWMAAGWRTTDVDLVHKSLVFVKEARG